MTAQACPPVPGPPPPRLTGLPPVADERARLLVLGSFPGAESLRQQRYYAHPRNQFWPLLSRLLGCDLVALAYGERLRALRDHGLALWDVHAECARQGSLDSAIRDPRPNDIAALVRRLPQLRGIAHNGGESARARRVTGTLGLPVWRLPSTSPAHARWSLERKCEAWREALHACGVAAASARRAVP